MKISGTRLSILRGERWPEAPDDELLTWVLAELHPKAGAINRSDDRYARIVEEHPIHLP